MNIRKIAVVLGAALPIMASVAAVPSITEPTQYYILHASGHHIGKGGNGTAVLESVDAESPTMMTISPLADNYYSIALPDDGGYLSLDGDWNTGFLPDADAPQSQFLIEEVSEYLLRFKCKANGKYLGTDGDTPGAYVFADKGGDQSMHYWYLSKNVDEQLPMDRSSYVINPTAEDRQFDGWGVSLCWWASMCGKWSDKKIDEIVDWLVSPSGLNYSVFRYNIGGGDDPNNANCDEHHMGKGKGLRAEMEGFKDSSDGPYIWERDAAQRKIMLKIKEKRPDAVFEAFSNSAPWYMTYSGCVAGNDKASKDNLKPEYYEEFANYLVDVCKHYKDEYGIEFQSLEPFNEPMTNYWGRNGGQEGCHFDVNSQIAFIKVLYPILQASGLSTVISASDETSVWQGVADYNAYKNGGVIKKIGQFNVHSYQADNSARKMIRDLCTASKKTLWMSETGDGGSGLAGNLKMAQRLIDDMRYMMPSVWCDWQYIEEYNDQWCLVRADGFNENNYKRLKNYYVRKHFSHFISPGYTMMTTSNSQTLAARNPEHDRLILVALNNNAYTNEHDVDLSMYTEVGDKVKAVITDASRNFSTFKEFELTDKHLKFSVPSTAIITFDIPVSTGANKEDEVKEIETDDTNIQLHVSNPSRGILRVWPGEGVTGRLDVHSAAGIHLYSRDNVDAPFEIPMSSGCYIVTLQTPDGSCTKTILVK